MRRMTPTPHRVLCASHLQKANRKTDMIRSVGSEDACRRVPSNSRPGCRISALANDHDWHNFDVKIPSVPMSLSLSDINAAVTDAHRLFATDAIKDPTGETRSSLRQYRCGYSGRAKPGIGKERIQCGVCTCSCGCSSQGHWTRHCSRQKHGDFKAVRMHIDWEMSNWLCGRLQDSTCGIFSSFYLDHRGLFVRSTILNFDPSII